MRFADIDVSARTEKGIISFNKKLLKHPEAIPSYMSHEYRHVLDQCLSDGPTQGSADDDYLDNPAEIDGFNTQTKFLSETEGDEAAENYIDKVLDFHEVPDKERKSHKEELLQLASQLNLEYKPIRKTKDELLEEYDHAISAGPQGNHSRKTIMKNLIGDKEKQITLDKLHNILNLLDNKNLELKSRKDLERKKYILQMSLDLV
jgi:hypothetical protein